MYKLYNNFIFECNHYKTEGKKGDTCFKLRDLDDVDMNISAYVTWGSRGSDYCQIIWNSDERKQSNSE